jgi:hypothetical protein
MSYRPILAAGLLSGAMDITAACINSGIHGVSPMRVLRYVAAGLLGAASRNGGLASASLGLICHFTIAMSASAVFYFASRKISFLTEQAVISGILYGVAVYFFMSKVVVPLSAAPPLQPSVASVLTGIGIHMICVGLPIALTIRWYSRQPG